ncbi:hypothetical protein [Pseudomonas oryzihabitans]|uniref:DUF4224 domain-containing protein n=1 Tax=Pseudomonas oryzihabitans TaxID=47885 RepID=A0AAJ2BGW0_9PSED|nr:hypothetical protein [Pseudomonas psychrotolerans]MDR6234031.1 hypothetical protein [Pseudomonas psychrotolerans]MDR6356873.1 hypothetical protein [Pseudomonas psychrotolerans]
MADSSQSSLLDLLPAGYLARLIGSSRLNTQTEWLRANGIPFLIGSDKRVKVLAAEVLRRLQSAPCCRQVSVEEKGEPIALEGLEVLSAQDKLTECQMAAELGITPRALQGRRYRGQIPEGVWMKDGRTTYYSCQKYEQWLESIWPVRAAQVVAKSTLQKRRKLRPPATFPLLV